MNLIKQKEQNISRKIIFSIFNAKLLHRKSTTVTRKHDTEYRHVA
jgi:hypothetical protein